LDRAHRLCLRRFSQSIEASVGLAGKPHGIIGLNRRSSHPVARNYGKQGTDAPICQPKREKHSPQKYRPICTEVE
jgi:hypothetical protein